MIMQSVIVTIKTDCSHATYDVEVPTDLESGRLAHNIVAAVRLVDRDFLSDTNAYRLRIDHLGRNLRADETFAEAGVWDGSVVTIISRA